MSGVYCGSCQVTRGAGGFAHNCSPLGYSGLRVQISSATIPPSQLGVCGCECFIHHWWTELLELAHSAPAVKVVYLTRAAAQVGLPQRAELLSTRWSCGPACCSWRRVMLREGQLKCFLAKVRRDLSLLKRNAALNPDRVVDSVSARSEWLPPHTASF